MENKNLPNVAKRRVISGLWIYWALYITILLVYITYSIAYHPIAPKERTQEIYFSSGDIIGVILHPVHQRDLNSKNEFDRYSIHCGSESIVLNRDLNRSDYNLCEIQKGRDPSLELPGLVYETRLMEFGTGYYLPMRSYILTYPNQMYLAYIFHPYASANREHEPDKAFIFSTSNTNSKYVINVDTGNEWWYHPTVHEQTIACSGRECEVIE